MKVMSQILGLTRTQETQKRTFDFTFALIGLFLLWPVILLSAAMAAVDTSSNGFFFQTRVGRSGRLFNVIKIRTMRHDENPRVTRLGAWFRRMKIDEFPQLVNVLLGEMSFVGPRPDVPGYADELQGEDRVILQLRPGITGPATLKYGNEEAHLAKQNDPDSFNRSVIWPDKVRINRGYAYNYAFLGDLRIILQTVLGAAGRSRATRTDFNK